MLNPVAYPTAQRLTRELAHSALPNAPMVPHVVEASGRVRRSAATTLSRLAGRLQRA
jgi:hypothetical protein